MSQQGIVEPAAPILWVVGLRNPGAAYEGTRHNAGADLAKALAQSLGASWSMDKAAKAQMCASGKVRFALPEVWMNESGLAVGALSRRMGLSPEAALIVHDDVELAPGEIRLKFAGGFAGHNGLRSIGQAIGADYWRLRVGVGHPQLAGAGGSVADWSLSKPSPSDRAMIAQAVDRAIGAWPALERGDFACARQMLAGSAPASKRSI